LAVAIRWLVMPVAAVKPLADYPDDYYRIRHEAQDQMAKGAEQFGAGDRLSGGAGDVLRVARPQHAAVDD
jgi:hypothetical protein